MRTYREKIDNGLNADIFCDNDILAEMEADPGGIEPLVIKEEFLEAVADAPLLLEALKDAEKALERMGVFRTPSVDYRWLEAKIDDALDKAERS